MFNYKTGRSRKEYFGQMMLRFGISQWPNDATTKHICPQNPSIPSGEIQVEIHISLSMKSPVFAQFYRTSAVFRGTDNLSVPPPPRSGHIGNWGPLIIAKNVILSSHTMDPEYGLLSEEQNPVRKNPQVFVFCSFEGPSDPLGPPHYEVYWDLHATLTELK